MAARATETAITAFHVIRAAARAGLAPGPLFECVGLDAGAAARFEVRVPIERLFALWEMILDALRDPRFPVEASAIPSVEQRSPLTLLLASCATVRELAAQIFRYQKVVANAFAWHASSTEGVYTFEGPRATRLGAHCHVEFHIADGVRGLKQWTRGRWFPTRVGFAHPAPRDVSAHLEVFGPGLRFGCARNELVLARDVLDMPLATASKALRGILERHVQALMATVDGDASEATRVREIVVRQIRDASSLGLDAIAARRGVSARTLHRKLAAEETSFTRVVDEARRELALEMLAGSSEPLKGVALALGFADVRCFHRAFSRWTGRTPREWSRRHKVVRRA